MLIRAGEKSRTGQRKRFVWLSDSNRSYGWPGVRNVDRYSISGRTHIPAVLRKINDHFKLSLNSCLIVAYRDGRESLGIHRDVEEGNDPNSPVVSLSLGATRTLNFYRDAKGKKLVGSFCINSGDAVVFTPECNRELYHGVAREKGPVGERIVLSFRKLLPDQSPSPGASQLQRTSASTPVRSVSPPPPESAGNWCAEEQATLQGQDPPAEVVSTGVTPPTDLPPQSSAPLPPPSSTDLPPPSSAESTDPPPPTRSTPPSGPRNSSARNGEWRPLPRFPPRNEQRRPPPPSNARRASSSQQHQNTTPRIEHLVLGDSLVRGIQLGSNVHVEARGGWKIDGYRRLLADWQVDPHIKSVSLLIGTNNLTDENCSPEEIVYRYTGLVEDVKRKFPRARIFCNSLLPRGEPDHWVARKLMRVNEGIERFIGEGYHGFHQKRVAYSDLLWSFLRPCGSCLYDPFYVHDKLHLSNLGKTHLTSALKFFIDGL